MSAEQLKTREFKIDLHECSAQTVATIEGFSNAHEWYVLHDTHLKNREEMRRDLHNLKDIVSVHSHMWFVRILTAL